MKKMMCVFVFLVLGLGLSWFGGTATAQGVEITFWYALGGSPSLVFQDMVADFNKTHPEIKVTAVQAGDYTTTVQKAIAASAAGKPPDVIMAEDGMIYQVVKTGDIVLIEDLVSQDPQRTKMEGIMPELFGNAYYEAKLWSWPLNKSDPILFVNNNLFEKAGLDPKRPPETWKEVLEYSQKITRPPDMWGIVVPAFFWIHEALVWSNGGAMTDMEEKYLDLPMAEQRKMLSLYGGEATRVAFDSPKAAEAVQFIADLIKKYKVSPYATWQDSNPLFISGKIGMVLQTPGAIAYLEEECDFDFTCGFFPRFGDRPQSVPIGGANFVIFKVPEERIQAAWTWALWFSDAEQTAYWHIRTGYLPLRDSPTAREYWKEHPNNKVAFDQIPYGRPRPVHPVWAEIQNIEHKWLDKCFTSPLIAKEAMSKAAEEANRVIRRWRRKAGLE